MPTPIVSVLMPCFNHERYVAQALQSIADSTYSAIELVVIDDASTDGTYQVAQDWVAAHSSRFVRVVCKRNDVNKGIAATLNRLLSHAQGDIVTVCASDDMLVADGMAKQVRCMMEQDVDFVFADARLVREDGTSVSDSAIRFFRRDPAKLRHKSCLIVDVLLNWEAPWTRVFAKASLMHRFGGFDESLHFEDRDFIVRVVCRASFALLPEPVYCYRIRLNNRLTPGLDAQRMKVDYLRAENKNFRASSGIARIILALNVLAGRIRIDRDGGIRKSIVWPFFALLRRLLAYSHLLAMR